MTEHPDIKEIRTLLADRQDVMLLPRLAVVPPGAPSILGVHLRRCVETEVRAPDSYNPYNYKGWKYYGQSFAIDRPSRGKLTEDQQEWRKAFEAVGGLYIAAKDINDVTRALGKEPDDVAEYLARAPMKRF